MFERRPHFQGYATPTKVKPEWTVPYLVFQGGVPRTRDNSLTGGGQIYGREFQAMFSQPPVIVPNRTPIVSLVGGGSLPSMPASLQALLGGAQGSGS